MPLLAIGGFEIVAFVVALMILLLLFAGDKIMGLIASILGTIPVIGGTIQSAINSGTAAAMKAFSGVFMKFINPVAELFYAIGAGIWWIVWQHVNVLKALQQMGYTLFTHTTNTAQAALNQAKAFTIFSVQGLTAEVQALQGIVQNDLENVGSIVAADLLPIEQDIRGLQSQVQSEAATILGQAEALVGQGIQTAEGVAQALSDQVLGEAQSLFGEAEHDIIIIQGQIQALPGQIEGTIPGIVQGVVPGIVAGLVPGILSQVIPRVQALEGEVTECLEPLCDTVTPRAPQLGNLGKLFQELEDLGIEAFFIALAAEAVHDPKAVADDITTVVQDIGGGFMTGFRDLIGV